MNKKYSTFIITVLIWISSGCASLPDQFERSVSHALSDTQSSALGRYVASIQVDSYEESGFHLLPDGLDAFVARAVLADSAEQSIDAQYYLYHQDLVGRLFTDCLLKAADKGIRVRLLVDDMDMAGRDKSAVVMDSHPNIEVRIFNPFSRDAGRFLQYVTRMGSVTRRMHNKSFTVDNQITVLGGRNIGNEYFSADPDLAFADLDVIGVGAVARNVSSVFDKYWNSELAYPVSALYKGKPLTSEEIDTSRKELNRFVEEQKESPYLKALQQSNLAEDLRKNEVSFKWGQSEVVFDQPEKLTHSFEDTQFHLSPMLKPYWEGVEKELIIFSPYFVPGKEGTAFLTQMAKKGVQVKILTNSLASNDVGLVHAGYMKYRKELLRNGVALYELNKALTHELRKSKKSPGGSSKASLHAKSFVFDRKQVFIGSLNLDPRALKHNTEIGVILKVPEIAEFMAIEFDKKIGKAAFRLELKKDSRGLEQLLWHGVENGKPVVYTHEPYTGFWRRVGIGFMSILPIESQL
jgi:putative cardiolipin synthase